MQEDVRYNRLLPYADYLDTEADEYLSKIKKNVARAVALQEMRPGLVFWSSEIVRYVRLYGRRFSKEDHVYFVKLFYHLLTTPDLEPQLIDNWGSVLLTLLKKKKLLSRSDLVLPWRPLYHTVQECLFGKYKKVNLKYVPKRVEEKLISVIKCTRTYFPASSTAEMLEEWRPYLCPFDMSMVEKVGLLCAFLPTQVMPDEHNISFKLWFDEFMRLWDDCQNNVQWEDNWMSLIARLARNTIGYIDWSPHISKIFTRILRSFGLPVSSQDQGRPSAMVRSRCHYEYNIKDVVMIIVALMGGGSTAQQHLTMLLKAIEPFYHPSYSGSWSIKLCRFLSLLPAAFVARLHNERYRKSGWMPEVPSESRLTDEDVTHFVKSMEDVVFMAMANKIGSMVAAATVKNLAILKPDLVLPQLIDRMYMAFETLTEPHQLSAMLHSLAFVSRVMLNREKFPDGASHALPLLKLVLPGIDPNDFFKSVSVFTFISTFSCLIPFVDCSKTPQLRNDLTDAEKEVCSATAQFEEFIVLLLDRCFALIENCSLEQAAQTDRQTETRQASQEQLMGSGLGSTLQSVFCQCSPELFQVALEKLVRFATSNVFETDVAGKMCSHMCRSAVKAYPDLALKLFIPRCHSRIQILTGDLETRDAEHADKELLWYLQLITEVVRCPGSELLLYESQLTDVLRWCVHLRCKDASKHAAQFLQSILQFLLGVYPLEWRSLPIEFSLPVDEHLYYQDWAAVCDLQNVQVKWYTPLESHVAFAKRLLSQFVIPEIEKLHQCSISECNSWMEKDELHQSLKLLHYSLCGAAPILKHIDSPVVSGQPDTLVSQEKMFIRYSTLIPSDVALDERLSRESLAKLMHSLLEHMWQEREHDTKALLLICEIYFTLLLYYGVTKKDFDSGFQSFDAVQRVMEDRLRERKRYLRPTLIDRLQLQHERRVMEAQQTYFTEIHLMMMKDLLTMSTSVYTEVRIKCQPILRDVMFAFRYSSRMLLPSILENLQESDSVSHEQFKGSLYVLQTDKCLYLGHCFWDTLSQIWLAVVQADHSEKPSISNLISSLVKRLMGRFNSPAICVMFSQAAIDMGIKMASDTGAYLTEEELSAGAACLAETNKKTELIYENLVAQLVSLIESGKLRWRFMEFALVFLAHLIRHDRPLSTAAIKLFVQSLNHETLTVRKIAIAAVMGILKQQKRCHITITINPHQLAEIDYKDQNGVAIMPGDRPDNMWHRYDVEKLPQTVEKWNSTVFIDKTFWGYYCWPREMKAYAPYNQQPPVDRTRDKLSEGEAAVWNAFNSKEFVDKLVAFLSLEERKGRDKYDRIRTVMFKGLFRNFGDSFLHLFKPHLQKLCADKQESSQRCAAEIIAGLVRSCKHWPFDKVKALWEFLLPCLTTAFSEISVETYADWGSCLSDCSADRDPRRLHWLFEMIISSEYLNQSRGSFRDTTILYLLQRVLSQQEWRAPVLHHRLLEHLEPQLSHPYKLVRDRLGSLLSTVFHFDIELLGGRLSAQPQVADFVGRLVSGLQPLMSAGSDVKTDITEMDGATKAVDVDDLSVSLSTAVISSEVGGVDENERKDDGVMQLLKTGLNWLATNGSLQPLPPSLCRLLPMVLRHNDKDEDKELDILSKTALHHMAMSWLPTASVEPLLEELESVVFGNSWRATCSALSFISTIVFQNLLTLQNPKSSSRIQQILFASLNHSQLEVREAAAVCLSKLLQCGYLVLSSDMTKHFVEMTAVKLVRTKGKKISSQITGKDLVRRHGGVLGLAACVRAFPHSIPESIPDILVALSKHVHDPPVIVSTVKRTVADFKHTHRDTWELHKKLFTDDQLLILADLLISPNYFA
ncbi:proteasome activator complex subunit 4-like [Corticium candelabrum]|uniref:proteasome activator complex subunit 4-like n=1 Tax=Corticium candelabrum TaxID=121492 RepID=UPI002E26DAD8|nr:proteasome activator complex subunit 4-like [Corticium candelabrum]